VAFWVSTGARASELLGASCRDADPGQQLIAVIRKGTRYLQQLPASPDAFVWLRLYQAQLQGLVPAGPDDPLWWTLRRPFRQLSYHATYRMFGPAACTKPCIRCPLLRPDPAQRPRLAEIRDNLIDRIGESKPEGWTGEAQGLQVSLAAAGRKLAQMDQIAARRATATHLGMPGYPLAVSRTVTTLSALPAADPQTTSDQGKL
jgi:hypothetical protein